MTESDVPDPIQLPLDQLSNMQKDGIINGPDCPDCGHGMMGELTDGGAWCPTCKLEEREADGD